MANNKAFQIILDLMVNLKADKSKVDTISKQLETSLKKANPEVSIDTNKLKKGVGDILEQFKRMESATAELDKALGGLDIKLDSKQAEAAVKEISEMFKNASGNLANMDMSKFEKALDGLSDEGIEQIGTQLKKAFDEFDGEKFKKNIKDAADEMDNLKSSAVGSLEQQKKYMQKLVIDNKENTQEYKEAEKELKKLADNLKKVEEAEKKVGDNIGEAGKKFSVLDKLANFGLASEGIQNLTGAINEVSAPFLQLDKATQAMKTLGPEAKAMSGELRDVAVTMSKDLPFAAGEFQEAMGNAMASGVQGGTKELSAFAETAAKLATGGMAELPAVVQGLGATLNAFGASATEAGAYSDTMFNIVNAGVTTIDELNASLSGVTPTAAAMGVSFKDVGGELALMTQKGVPTAQAVSKLNAMMIEMQKPSAGIKEALNAAGVSAEEFTKQIREKGMTSALVTLQEGFKKTGKSATQMFSSSEASAAFNVLTGDMALLNKTMDDVANTSGSTENAYNEMSQSIEVRTKQMKAQFDAFSIGMIDSTGVLGEYAIVAGQTFAQLSPTITALAGMKSLLPTEAIGTFAKDLLVKLVPSLATTAVSSTAAGTAATAAGTAASTAWLSVLGPLALVVGAIGAVIAATKLISDAVHETAKEQLDSAKEQEEGLKAQEKTLLATKQRKATNLELIKSYEALGAKQNKTKAEEEEFRQMQVKVAQSFPGVISGTKSFAENLTNLKQAGEKSKTEILGIDKQLNELDKNLDKARVFTMRAEVNMSKEKIEDDLTEVFKDVSPGWDGASEWLFGTSNARKMAEDAVKGYTDGIYNAKTKEQVADAGAKMQMALWNDKKFASVPEETKKKLVAGIGDMMDKRNAEIDKKTKDDTEKMQKGIKAAFDAGTISDAKIQEIAKKFNVPLEQAQQFYNQYKEQVKTQKIGDLLKESATLKGDLDSNNKVGELVEKFKNAKTEVEKASIAEEIKKQAPEAVQATGSIINEEGKLINTYSITTSKIKESKEAQKNRLDGDMQAKQQAFVDSILSEKDAYLANIAQMAKLKVERDKLASQGLDTSKIDAQINELGAKNQAFLTDVTKNIMKYEEKGLDTTGVYEKMAKTLGKSPAEVKKLVEAQKKSIGKQQELNKEAAKLGDYFNNAANAASTKFNDALNKSLDILQKRKEAQKAGNAELVKQYDAELKQARAEAKEADKQNDSINKMKESETKRYEEKEKNSKSAYERAKEQLDKENQALDIAQKGREISSETLRLQEKREANTYDELLTERDKLKTLEQKKEKMKELYKITENADGTISVGIKVNAADEAEIKNALSESNMELQQQANTIQAVRVKIGLDSEEADKAIAEYETEKTLHEIEIGVRGTDSYKAVLETVDKQIATYQKAVDTGMEKVTKLQEEFKAKLATATNEDQAAEITAQYNLLITAEKKKNLENLKNLDDAKEKRTDITQKEFDARIGYVEEYYEKKRALLEGDTDEEKKAGEKLAAAFQTGLNKAMSDNDGAEETKLQNQMDSKLKILESYKEMEAISTEEYESRKTDLEEEAAKKREKIQEESRRRQLRMQAYFDSISEQKEREKEKDSIKLKKDEADAKLKVIEFSTKTQLEKNGTSMEEIQALTRKNTELEKKQMLEGFDEKRQTEIEGNKKLLDAKLDGIDVTTKKSLEELTKTSDVLGEEYKKKADLATITMNEAQVGISEAMASMFAGDKEAAADALRSSFASIMGVMVELLKKKIDAAILTLITDWLGEPATATFGFYAKMAMIPLIQGLAGGAIHAIADPILNNLLSFSTGGSIDSPTLALIGDGAKLGGSNKEWIFRDEQLKQTLQLALDSQSNQQTRYLATIANLMATQEISTTLQGADIKVSLSRTKFSQARRAR